jgi:hypothetical protein
MPVSATDPQAQLSVDRSEEKAFGLWIYLMTDAIE